MSRLEKMEQLKAPLIMGKYFKKLTKDEMAQVIAFIKERENFDKNQYMHDANRWHVDNKNKPKHHVDMWSIVVSVA